MLTLDNKDGYLIHYFKVPFESCVGYFKNSN